MPRAYRVTLTCGCSWITEDPPALGDLYPCPQENEYRVVWVRPDDEEEDE